MIMENTRKKAGFRDIFTDSAVELSQSENKNNFINCLDIVS